MHREITGQMSWSMSNWGYKGVESHNARRRKPACCDVPGALVEGGKSMGMLEGPDMGPFFSCMTTNLSVNGLAHEHYFPEQQACIFTEGLDLAKTNTDCSGISPITRTNATNGKRRRTCRRDRSAKAARQYGLKKPYRSLLQSQRA